MITHFPRMTCCEWWLAFVLQSTEVPRLVNNVNITPRPRPRCGETRKTWRRDSLSHALLARCLLNEGCPGGTDCDDAEGLYARELLSCTGSARHLRGRPSIGRLRSQWLGCRGRCARHEGMFPRHEVGGFSSGQIVKGWWSCFGDLAYTVQLWLLSGTEGTTQTSGVCGSTLDHRHQT